MFYLFYSFDLGVNTKNQECGIIEVTGVGLLQIPMWDYSRYKILKRL